MRREKKEKETHLTLIERNVSEAVDFFVIQKITEKKLRGRKGNKNARKENRFCIEFPIAAVIIIISRGFIDFPPRVSSNASAPSAATAMNTRYPFHHRF